MTGEQIEYKEQGTRDFQVVGDSERASRNRCSDKSGKKLSSIRQRGARPY